MKSTIRVEYDFDEKSPYLQMRLEGHDEENGDFKDKLMQNFIEESNQEYNELSIEYRGAGNYLPQIRIRKKAANSVDPKTLNWVGLNSTSKANQGPVYKKGYSYDLIFATGSNNMVYIKTVGEDDIMEYNSISDFISKWSIIPAE